MLISRRESDTVLHLLEGNNLRLARQICQSYNCSRNFCPVGNPATDFAFRVAYLVPDEGMREWILKKMNEMARPLGGGCEHVVKAAELECFDYLKY